MSERLIPNGDLEFSMKAHLFAGTVAKDPERFGLSADDAQAMFAAAERFNAASQMARSGSGGTRAAKEEKDEARAAAAKMYKRCVDTIRLHKGEDSVALITVGLAVPTGKRKSRVCPQEPPRMEFVQALHAGSGALPMHELKFCSLHSSKLSKPPGATRLELFVDLIAPDERVPQYPGANDGGRPWYLRSFSRSPIRIAPPICRVPMLVLYWGRWADAVGNVGPFSRTVVSRIEGWSQHVMMHDPRSRRPDGIKAFDDPARFPAGERKYSVQVLDAQYRALHAQAIEGPKQETRQLEGPAESEAA